MTRLNGQCLCGAVTVSMTAAQDKMSACHCDMCRRWCSGPFIAIGAVIGSTEVNGPSKVIQTSDWAERAHCGECGSALWYRMTDPEGPYNMAAGLFDTSGMALTLEVWIDHKPDGYAFAGTQKTMTEAECMAFFAPPEQGDTP